jgi:hypothetical protein
MDIQLEAMAIEMPHVDGHPNRLPFRGVLTLVDVPSDHPPSGAGEHRVILTRAAAEKALPSLLGMALDFKPNLDGHDARMKVGVITSADILPADGKWEMANGKNAMSESPAFAARPFSRLESAHQLEISGYIFAKDFPEIVELMRDPTQRQKLAQGGAPSELGMSWELTDVIVADKSAPIWVLTSATFTGAAMLLRDKAAYRETWIELEPQQAAVEEKAAAA